MLCVRFQSLYCTVGQEPFPCPSPLSHNRFQHPVFAEPATANQQAPGPGPALQHQLERCCSAEAESPPTAQMYQLRSRLAPRAGTPGQEQHPPQRDLHLAAAAAAATANGTCGATLGAAAKGTATDVAATDSSDRQTPEPEAGRAGSQGPIKKRFKVTASSACTGMLVASAVSVNRLYGQLRENQVERSLRGQAVFVMKHVHDLRLSLAEAAVIRDMYVMEVAASAKICRKHVNRLLFLCHRNTFFCVCFLLSLICTYIYIHRSTLRARSKGPVL